MALRRRQYRNAREAPIAYPAWRRWEDRRIRTDDAVMALFAGLRVARAELDVRSSGKEDVLVSTLYADSELEYRNAFRVTVSDAKARWRAGLEELARATVLLGVASLDDLLGATITLTRECGCDSTSAGEVETGVSAKLRHVVQHAELPIPSGTVKLHDLLLSIRHSVTHYGAQQRVVRRAWEALSAVERQWWSEAAGRALTLTSDTDELVMDDREVLATFKTLDRVAVDVNLGLRGRVPESEWAKQVVAEFRALAPTKAGDPARNVGAVVRHAANQWRLALGETAVQRALLRGSS
jgi:hypothetical protein